MEVVFVSVLLKNVGQTSKVDLFYLKGESSYMCITYYHEVYLWILYHLNSQKWYSTSLFPLSV